MQPQQTPSWATDPQRQPWTLTPPPSTAREAAAAPRPASPAGEEQPTPESERPSAPVSGRAPRAAVVTGPWQFDPPPTSPRSQLRANAGSRAAMEDPAPPPAASSSTPPPVAQPSAAAALADPAVAGAARAVEAPGLPAGFASPAAPRSSSAASSPGPGLTFDSIVTHRSARPTQGWRAAVFTLTGGLWNPGPSRAEREYLERLARIRTPLPGRHLVTVMSLKGGIGKTTSAALLGLVLAEYRGDHVIAMDANPDAGTLAERLLGQQPLTNVQHLLVNAPAIEHASDLARITELAGRLQVLASEQNPLLSQTFDETKYRQVLGVLKKFCNVIITDTGTGVVDSVVQGALAQTHSLIVTGAPTGDGAVLASRTLDWLTANGHGRLVERAVVVLSCDRVSRDINRADLRAHFEGRARAVVEIPRDPHLAKGQQIHLDELRPVTKQAALELAALVAEQFRTVNDADPIVREHQR